MNTYTFIGAWLDRTYGLFTEPVRWTEGGSELEVLVSLSETNHQFVTEAYRFNGHEGQPLMLVTAEGKSALRANVKAVTLKPGEKVKIKIQPNLNPL